MSLTEAKRNIFNTVGNGKREFDDFTRNRRRAGVLENVAQLPYVSRINKLVHVQTDKMG